MFTLLNLYFERILFQVGVIEENVKLVKILYLILNLPEWLLVSLRCQILKETFKMIILC